MTLASLSSRTAQIGTIQGLGIVVILICLWMGLSGLFDLLLGRYTLGAAWERLEIGAQARFGRILALIVLAGAIAAYWLVFADS